MPFVMFYRHRRWVKGATMLWLIIIRTLSQQLILLPCLQSAVVVHIMLKCTEQLNIFFFCMCFHRQSIQVSGSPADLWPAGCSEIMWTGPLFRCDTVPHMLVCIMGEAAGCFWSSALGCVKCLSCVQISYDSQDNFIISRIDFYWKATRGCRWIGSPPPRPLFPWMLWMLTFSSVLHQTKSQYKSLSDALVSARCLQMKVCY